MVDGKTTRTFKKKNKESWSVILDKFIIYYDGIGDLYTKKGLKTGGHHTCTEIHYFFCNKEFDNETKTAIFFSIIRKTKLKNFEFIASSPTDPINTGTTKWKS